MYCHFLPWLGIVVTSPTRPELQRRLMKMTKLSDHKSHFLILFFKKNEKMRFSFIYHLVYSQNKKIVYKINEYICM